MSLSNGRMILQQMRPYKAVVQLEKRIFEELIQGSALGLDLLVVLCGQALVTCWDVLR